MLSKSPGTEIHNNDIQPDPDGPFPMDIPFIRHLGIRLHGFGDGRAELRLTQQDHMSNSFAMTHGGVVMTLLDISMAMAGRANSREDDDQTKGMITIEMKTSFMQPSRGDLRAMARCISRTRALGFCEAELFDADDQLVAKASGTFKYFKNR